MARWIEFRNFTTQEPDWRVRHAIHLALGSRWSEDQAWEASVSPDPKVTVAVTEKESWPCEEHGPYHIHTLESLVYGGASEEEARVALAAREAAILALPDWERYVAPPPVPTNYTAADFAAKISWEGGIMEALEYGLRGEDTIDPELASLWDDLVKAYDHGHGQRGLKDLIEQVQEYLATTKNNESV